MTEQLPLLDGLRRRDEGMARAEANAETFVRVVRSAMVRLSMERGSACADDAREFAREHGLVAPSKFAWGAIWQATRSGRWVKVGGAPSRVPENHAHVNKLWRYVPKEET